MFAVFMGLSRVLFAKFGSRLDLRPALMIASAGCMAGYALCAFAPPSLAWLGLCGCAVVGFFVGIMWPGTFSYASAGLPKGGTAMFALLALAGDVGCAAGPSAVGAVSDLFGGELGTGIAFGILFPAVMFVAVTFCRKDPSRLSADLSEKTDA